MSETLKAEPRRIRQGIYETYLQGKVLDVGYNATGSETMTGIDVTGLDFNTPGYDGHNIPWEGQYFDCVYSSHMLEHVENDIAMIQEMFRVTKVGGYLFAYVPHQFLYEKSYELPSRFNPAHKRMYTASILCAHIEEALGINNFRIRWLQECDEGFDYKIPASQHSVGEYAIEAIVERLR